MCPASAFADVSGQEDLPIPLDIAASLNDLDGETLTITNAGIPDGATLASGGVAIEVVNASATLSPNQLADLTFTAPENFSGTINLNVTATAAEDGTSASVSQSLVVTVDGLADPPIVTVTDVTGAEDTAIALDLAATVADPSGETLSITLEGIPEGATVASGEVAIAVVAGSATLSPDLLAGLTLTPPSNSDDDFTLQVTATASEDGTDAAATVSLDVTVSSVVDTPTVTVLPAAGGEDSAIPLDIAALLTDLDGSESLSITLDGIPVGAVLSAGMDTAQDNGDGTFSATLTANQLSGLTLTPPADSDDDFTLQVTAAASEGGEVATAATTFDLTVTGVADAPTVTLTTPARGPTATPTGRRWAG